MTIFMLTTPKNILSHFALFWVMSYNIVVRWRRNIMNVIDIGIILLILLWGVIGFKEVSLDKLPCLSVSFLLSF